MLWSSAIYTPSLSSSSTVNIYRRGTTKMLRSKVSSLVQLLGFIALLVAVTASAVVAGSNITITISPNCLDKCGNISIPYPFGVGDGCVMEGFEVRCENGSLYIGNDPVNNNIEMIDISLATAQARVYKYISYACYNETGLVDDSINAVMTLGTPYMFSSTRNKFTAIGCATLAYFGSGEYLSGCVSSCINQSHVEAGPCTGRGCCQTSISKGMGSYEVAFGSIYNHSSVVSFSPCSYAFLADEQWFKFNQSDVVSGQFYWKNNKRVQLVLDWAIRNNGTCQEAGACRSAHSKCIDSTNGPGYICNCSAGFQGNPYLVDGCQDIDECNVGGESYPCYGDCTNTVGSYDCLCPRGTHSYDPKKANCTADSQKQQESTATKIALGGISCFIIIAIAFLAYERTKLMRAKRRCFEENGGFLLQEQINAHQGVNFKIFKKEEMEKATRNFDPSLVLGQGGFGIVYKGELDKKTVAIKISKSKRTDQSRDQSREQISKEFAKEMSIVSLLNHKNVIKILGYCLEDKVPMLVYQFVSGGNLHDYIHREHAKMPLYLRFKIAVESASALAYIHTDAEPRILHGDIKPQNILIGDGFRPILSDFGGALLSSKDQNSIQGTKGYLDPECLQTWQITEKSDVYSFAVVLLELFTRRKVISEGSVNLVSVFKQKSRGNRFADIIDVDIIDEIKAEQLDELDRLLEQCFKEGVLRPTMKEVEERLQRMAKMCNNSVVEAEGCAQMMPASIEPRSSTTPACSQYYERYSGTAFSVYYDGR